MMTSEAVDEMGLQEGDLATAVVKSTNVIVEIPSAPEPGGRVVEDLDANDLVLDGELGWSCSTTRGSGWRRRCTGG